MNDKEVNLLAVDLQVPVLKVISWKSVIANKQNPKVEKSHKRRISLKTLSNGEIMK